MRNCEKLLSYNRERSEEKVALAKAAIQQMEDDGERICIAKLIRLTGLSKGFFYKNAEVRSACEAALSRQGSQIDPRRKIFDKAVEEKIGFLQTQIETYKADVARLEQENEKLKKCLDKKKLNYIKSL